ncbi:phenylalanine--tRNA ligase subunit beta [Chloroflexota bacterium]
MKVPLKWLQEYVDVTLPPAEIADRLTMAGSEVGELQIIGDNWEHIIIGQITAVNPHPNADRLRLATVDLDTETQTVVCGAPNLNIGDKIAFARVGARLVDPHNGQLTLLKAAKIRGVDSSGMVCAERELGISDDYEGIMVLPPELPVGTPLADHLGNTIFNLDITPNRPDCLSVIGIAREVAALTGQSPHIPEISYEEASLPIDRQISVEIIDPELCPRYCASLITGIEVGESPGWIQERLLACGMRPINNVVDITNYVMLEYGQPLHAFDYDKISEKKIIVRRAGNGETIESLDGAERNLTEDMLVIADEARAIAIAGVMGSANSEVSQKTTSILLEAASFNPASIHYTAARLMLTSEASMRFERGVRPGLAEPALRHATQLIMQLGGGKIARGIADVYPGKRDPEPILLSQGEVTRLLGIEFSMKQITGALTSLGFEVKTTDSDSEVLATTPYWRNDISLDVDLIEEIARIIGYDRIPTTLLGEPLPRQNPEPLVSLKRKIRHNLTGYGFQEIITYSLNSLAALNQLAPEPSPQEPELLHLLNPMTVDQEYLRPNLRVNLLTTLAENRRYEDGNIRLFEMGRVYLPRDNDLPDEPEFICALLSGARQDKSWLGEESTLDFFDAKGMVESLLKQMGLSADFENSTDESLHPSRQAAVVIDGEILGVLGEVHPKVTNAFEINEPVYLFELNISALLPFITRNRMFQPVSRFPHIIRDMALIVAGETTHRLVRDTIRSFPLVTEVTLFDVYSGEPVPPDKKSLAYRVIYQSAEHTLTDEEVDRVQKKILERLSRELGATLRG